MTIFQSLLFLSALCTTSYGYKLKPVADLGAWTVSNVIYQAVNNSTEWALENSTELAINYSTEFTVSNSTELSVDSATEEILEDATPHMPCNVPVCGEAFQFISDVTRWLNDPDLRVPQLMALCRWVESYPVCAVDAN